MELRPHHAARRRGASDVPDRLERRLAGDPRRHGADRGITGRRRARRTPRLRRGARRLRRPPTAPTGPCRATLAARALPEALRGAAVPAALAAYDAARREPT